MKSMLKNKLTKNAIFDMNTNIIAIKNSVYDLNESKFRKVMPHDMIINSLNYDYVPIYMNELDMINQLNSMLPNNNTVDCLLMFIDSTRFIII